MILSQVDVRGAAATERVSVLVCRGCCCGTGKHPDVDHAAQVRTLREHLPVGDGGRLWEVDCLGPCARSNVVVVRRGRRRRWFGGVLDATDTVALATWVRSGARGEPPAAVAALEFDPHVADDRSSRVPVGARPVAGP